MPPLAQLLQGLIDDSAAAFDSAIVAALARQARQSPVVGRLADEGEPNCGDVDPDEGACILVLDHDGGHWHSMFGTPRL